MAIAEAQVATRAAPAADGGGGGGGGGGGARCPRERRRASDVMAAMSGVRGDVQGVRRTGLIGIAHCVAITFASSGRVTSANVGGAFAGTPAGSCIARAVLLRHASGATRSRARATFTVNYRVSRPDLH